MATSITLSQTVQGIVILASIVFQYYWFIEHKTPLQIYHEWTSQLLQNESVIANGDHDVYVQTQALETAETTKRSYSTEAITGDSLLPSLISYEFESALQYFEYNSYPQKSTMHLQLWSLFFETLSNNYYYQIQRNKHSPDITLSSTTFRSKTWQQAAVLLTTRELYEKYAPFDAMPTAYAYQLLNAEQVMTTLDGEKIYESPYAMFFHEKLHTANMDLSAYKQRNKQLSADYVSLKLSEDTLVINNAGLIFQNVALLEQIIMNTFYVPVNTNAYVSGKRSNKPASQPSFSSTIHADRQDIFIIQTQGRKRWQVWRPLISHPRFEQIRGKDDNVVSEEEMSKLDLLYDVVLSPGDILYIPRGYLHAVSLADDEDAVQNTEDNDAYSVHLSVGLEIETLGFTTESFIFCAMGLSLQTPVDVPQSELNEADLEQRLQAYQRLTWLSGYLWQYTFMVEDLRKGFPFFESEYILRKLDGDADPDAQSMDENERQEITQQLQEFQKTLYRESLALIEKFRIALNNTANVDREKLRENQVPNVSVEDLKRAHSIFHDAFEKLRALFLAKMSLAADAQFQDVVDRNAKFDELVVHHISSVYQQCGVPVDIVGDGSDEGSNIKTKS